MTKERLTRTQWRRLGLSVYLPTGVSFVGFGAIVPLVPLTAQDLGADVATAAFLVGLMGLGSFLGALPAGRLAAAIGEKHALLAALVADAALLVTMGLAGNVITLGAAVFAAGLTGSVLSLARQAYLTDVVPAAVRGRALSTLGGVFRIGGFLGPLLGAAVVSSFGLRAGYAMAVVTSLIAAALTVALPDLAPEREPGSTAVWPVIRRHWRSFATVGLGAAALMLVRTARDAILPLWASEHGLDPAGVSLVFALSLGLDMLLFYAGGAVMDRFGRQWVAVPSLIAMGTCFALLAFSHSIWTIAAVAAALGLGNGISSGVVMTMGSDASPTLGRPQYLAGWRFTTGLGQAASPLLVGALSAIASLAAASLGVAVVAFVGAAWLWRWLGRDPEPLG